MIKQWPDKISTTVISDAGLFSRLRRKTYLFSASLAVQIERVKAYAVADRGSFAPRVEAAKKVLPSGTRAVMAGAKKRSAMR
jgi:hypothetical protein